MWKIIIIKDKERTVKDFKDEKKAQEYFEEMTKKYENEKDISVYKISARDHIPLDPTKEKPKQRKKDKSHPLYWCPYCGDWRNYKLDYNRTYACPICTVTIKDFYVKQMNHLW